jgi:predicted nucleic acid-binding Zn finger protein
MWLVPSATRADRTYVVDDSRATCTCLDFVENGEMCKHLWAVAYIQNEITLLDGTQLAPPPVAKDEDSGATVSVQGAS